jgi:hypothetical protein
VAKRAVNRLPIAGHADLPLVYGDELTSAPVERPAALKLDPVIHERVRLGIISALAVNEALSFNASTPASWKMPATGTARSRL